jgi:hypothetical protein
MNEKQLKVLELFKTYLSRIDDFSDAQKAFENDLREVYYSLGDNHFLGVEEKVFNSLKEITEYYKSI